MKSKYLLTIVLASLLSLVSCGSTPSGDTGGNPPSGGGGENPPVETEEKVTITFSNEYHSTQNFTTLTRGSFTIQAYKGYYGQTAPQYVESQKQLKLYASNELSHNDNFKGHHAGGTEEERLIDISIF